MNGGVLVAGTSPGQAALIALIVAAKFLLPLLIIPFPFAAGWANFFLDGFDGDLLIPLGLPNEIYQPVDKLTDWVTYVAIVVVAFRNDVADAAADARAVPVPLDRPGRVPAHGQRAASSPPSRTSSSRCSS